jgi:hypothetical protein
MTLQNKLTRGKPRRRKTETEYHIIQAALKQLDEFRAIRSPLCGGNGEKTTQIPLINAIRKFELALFAELKTELGQRPGTGFRAMNARPIRLARQS